MLAGGLLTGGMFAAPEEWGEGRPRPAGDNWRFSCRLENVGADDAAWVELRDATGGRLYRAGVAGGRSRLEQWQAGAWKRLWTGEPPADEAVTRGGLGAARRTEGVGVFCFNGYLFIEVGEPGDVRHVVPPPDVTVPGDIDPSTGKVFEAGAPAGTPAPGEIDWTVRAGTSAAGVRPRIVDVAFENGSRPQVQRAPDAPPLQREAIACYIPWFPADFTALGYQRQNDFPVVPLRAEAGYDVLAEEFRLMAAGGVTVVSADIVFFTPDRVRAGIVTFKRFLKTARSAGLGEFRVAPFVELKNIPMAVAAALYMMERMGDDPAWLRTGRRGGGGGGEGGLPVFLTYHHPMHLKMTPELWRSLLEGVREGGRDAYWVYNFDGLTPALTGRVDRSEADKIMPVSDAVFHFGGASLRDSAGFTKFIREQFSQKYPKVAVGASVHVGYYAARTYSRNFISPRHTAELREMWTLAEEGRPDFVHLTTWNDWNEATTFCPSFGDAGSRLEIMGRLLAGFLGKPLPEGKPGVPELVLSYRKSVYPGEPLRLEVLPLPTQNPERLGEVRCEVVVTEAASGRVVLRATSPALVMDASAVRGAMRPWYADTGEETGESALRAPGVLRVAARAWVDGREIRYHHLPDIVVSEPEGSNDQLFYSVPLHRLAGPERRVRLEINGRDGRDDANGGLNTSTVTGSGLYGVCYEVSGPGAADTLVAGMKRGHLMRFLAPLSCDGAEVVELDQPVRLTTPETKAMARANGRVSRPVAESSGRWTQSERGADYFSALARFEDGSWAWSPTVLATPPVPATAVVADWVFFGPKPALMGNVAGLNKPRNIIEDRSIYRQDLALPEKNGLRFVTLPGSGRACQFDGNTALRAEPDTAGNGPVAIEVLFSPGQAGRHETICWQRGAQAGLVVDAAGHLVASRLPELRKHPKPFVEALSKRPLETGRFYHAVAQFTGSALELWLDGELQEREPCVGTRSTEGFSIGGNSGGRAAATAVDEMPSEGFFTGRLARLTVYGRGLPESAVKDLHRAARQLPFFETNPQ